MYKNILVPHAGTSAGDLALEHAVYAAKGTPSAKMILLHVIEEVQRPPTFGLAESEREKILHNIDEANNSLKLQMQKEMQKRLQYCTENKVDVEIKIEVGDAARVILDCIKHEKIDLVVMAKRRKIKGIKKLFSLGSISRKVVDNAHCPITLVDLEKE
jgi:nucleotide-binding universal stress UspA family protein